MASITDGFTYDLFLSFRGEDTRYGFTGNLWKALDVRGIHTFIDDEELQKGDEITPALVEAIGKSRMAIVVLSKNYASSSFCLRELSEILDSIRNNGRPVWPIFYDVDPSDVRKLAGTYGEAMATHEAKFNHNMGLFQRLKNALYQVVNETRYNHDMELLQKWKNALYQVANLSGFHYKNGDGYEHEFIGKIVDQVSRETKPVTLPVGDYLVGLESKKREVELLLNVGSDDRVHMVGICGIGGIGKTTLALTVYNFIASQFQASCFLENVRANSEKHGLEYLQSILLSQIVQDKKMEVTSVKEGMSKIQQMLKKKKVLLLLDDVDNMDQLDAIVGNPNWFGLGSRVLITSRDKGLLESHGVGSTYDVKELKKKDAFELVRLKASKNAQSTSGYTNVVNRVVEYASGLPLALEVIGSHLFNKTIVQCESTLDRYERTPHRKIQTILRVSFDALEEEEKCVFLDIACCFRGHKLTDVQKILHAHHGDSMNDHITVLAEKSLIKIGESSEVILHDLIEDMGKEIVRQESPKEPGKRSRLWSCEDILGVLKANMETSENQIIYLDSPSEYVECDGQAFKKMKNLKTLIVRCDRFSTYPEYLPSSLRVLQLSFFSGGSDRSYSSEVLQFDYLPKNLVICKINRSHFTSILFRNLFNQDFKA